MNTTPASVNPSAPVRERDPEFVCGEERDGVCAFHVRFPETRPPLPFINRDLTSHHADDFRRALRGVVDDPGCRGVVVDLAGAEIVSGEILGVLVDARRRLSGDGHALVICGASALVRRTFEITRLSKFIAIVGSVGAGRSRLTVGPRGHRNADPSDNTHGSDNNTHSSDNHSMGRAA